MKLSRSIVLASAFFGCLQGQSAHADDQTVVGAGNAAAIALSAKSPLVQSANAFLLSTATKLHDNTLRRETLDAIGNPNTCVRHRAGVDAARKAAILESLSSAGLVNPADAASINGGLIAGVFPPVVNDGSSCPHLPQHFTSSPGSAFGGNHSYPGGLPIHETFNDLNHQQLASGYRRVYGWSRGNGLPEIAPNQLSAEIGVDAGFEISNDLTLGAPLWHDWAKPIVFQWNADGSEFTEFNFGGNGTTDNNGAAGDSRTGAHHILGIAEAMKRGLSPEFVITQASAHSTPTSGNEYKVVNWIRAAAIIDGIEPVATGYLRMDAQNHYRLPALRKLGSIDLNAAPGSPLNLLIEYTSHNLSDADFSLTGPAVSEAQLFLSTLASRFGYDPTDVTRYNTRYRNPALSYLSAERLLVLYSNGGIEAVASELQKLRGRGIL